MDKIDNLVDLKINQDELRKLTRDMAQMPGIFKRADKSALKSTGYFIRTELKEQVVTAGHGAWPDVHPLTKKYKKKFQTGVSIWMKRGKPTSPMRWLGKFSRYRVTNDEAVIGFGKSPTGKTGTVDPFLMEVVERAERGSVVRVTPAMRRFFAGPRKKDQGLQTKSKRIFPLSRSTTVLVTPRRPIFDPVLDRVMGSVAPYYEHKFWSAVNRYRSGQKGQKA